MALSHRRDHRRGRRPRPTRRPQRRVPDHDRLRRRDALPAARHAEALSAAKRTRWTFRTPLAPATGQLVNWWEGNVAYGPDSNLYVGNTGGGAFSLTPDGGQRWVTQRANSVWTTPAFDAEGNSYWGSVDFYAFSLDPAGNQRWQTFTPGYLTSSPALGSDGTVYIGSFDRSLHALDPATGAERWAFPTADHIYSSPALASDAAGNTKAIYIGSADGSIYAVAPDGTELWSYDTGDPVRASPVLGRAPKGDGKIVYVGSSNGVLYALDAETGKRRWSFDTTPGKAGLADRNDLNGSPALGKRGVYIGGEHGRVWFVPYDFCRKSDTSAAPPTRRRSSSPRSPGRSRSRPGARPCAARPRTCPRRPRSPPGWSCVATARRSTPRSTRPPSAYLQALVHFTSELSGDGHFLFIRPDAILKPETDYRVQMSGAWTAEGANGTFSKVLHYVTGPLAPQAHGPGDPERRGAGDRAHPPRAAAAGAAAEREPDRLRLLRPDRGMAHAAALNRGKQLLWVIGGRAKQDGTTVADPAGGFAFPLFGTYDRGQTALNTSQVSLQFSFGPVPLRSLDFRGATRVDGSFKPGASLYGQVTCADVPNYSAQLRIAGVCNSSDTLASYGTFLSDDYPGGGANAKPRGVRATGVQMTPPTASADGEAVASLGLRSGTRYPASEHLLSVLLVDAATGAPVPLDYRSLTTPSTDAAGNLTGASLRIPAGTPLPGAVRAYVVADVFPLGHTDL